MQITDAMIEAGIRKATESGLLAAHPSHAEGAFNRAVMRAIIEAAIHESDIHSPDAAARSLRSRDRWSFFSSK
jgi:hypothetical protein